MAQQANGIATPPPVFPADFLTGSQPGGATNGPKHIWYAAHVQDVGWQTPVRDGGFAGTTGQSKRLEALALLVVGCRGIAAVAHVQNIGWPTGQCPCFRDIRRVRGLHLTGAAQVSALPPESRGRYWIRA